MYKNLQHNPCPSGGSNGAIVGLAVNASSLLVFQSSKVPARASVYTTFLFLNLFLEGIHSKY
jgi:hypothetical protein